MAKNSLASAGARGRFDRKPTMAERLRAIAQLRKYGGAHVQRPANRFIGSTPADTLLCCRQCLRSHIGDDAGAMASLTSGLLWSVADALGHAERVLRDIGSDPDLSERGVQS
jgi:hypothetical protein